MLNVIMNEEFQSISKTKHSKLKVTSGGPTYVEPVNQSRQQQIIRDMKYLANDTYFTVSCTK